MKEVGTAVTFSRCRDIILSRVKVADAGEIQVTEFVKLRMLQ